MLSIPRVIMYGQRKAIDCSQCRSVFNFKHSTRLSHGFTLIELLVVIAIIGILSSIVLASLGSARSKGVAAAIKSQAGQFVTLLELEYSDSGSYDPLQNNSWNNCTGFTGNHASKAVQICESLLAKRYGTANDVYFGINTSSFNYSNTYSIMVRLPNGNFYCVGGSGAKYEGSSNPGSGSWTGKGCYANP